MEHELTLNDFSELLHQPFPVTAGAQKLDLVLIEVIEGTGGLPGGRQPFSLLFRGPIYPRLPQATYQFEHPQHGALAVFIVPIGANTDGTTYEAIFA